jgi:hypothetical protein
VTVARPDTVAECPERKLKKLSQRYRLTASGKFLSILKEA